MFTDLLHEVKWTVVLAVQLLGVIFVVRKEVGDLVGCKGPSMLPTIQAKGDLLLLARSNLLVELAAFFYPDAGLIAAPECRQQRELGQRTPSFLRSLYRLVARQELILSRGDVVVCQSMEHPTQLLCKRIVGLPGDVVVTPDTAHFFASPRYERVPEGMVFIQGDNLANSHDSRHYGCIPLALVQGRVVWKVYPRGQSGPVASGMERITEENVIPAHLVPEGWTAPKPARTFPQIASDLLGADSLLDLIMADQEREARNSHESMPSSPTSSDDRTQNAEAATEQARHIANAIEIDPPANGSAGIVEPTSPLPSSSEAAIGSNSSLTLTADATPTPEAPVARD